MRILLSSLFSFFVFCATCQTQDALRDSLSELNRQIDLHPFNTDLLLKRGGVEIGLESWNSAIDTYSQVLKTDAKNPAALFYRAFAYEQLGRFTFARRDYEDYLKIVPFNYEGMLCLALLNHRDKHYTESYDQINTLIEMNPDSTHLYVARANMEEDRDMTEPAIYDWGCVIEREPDVAQHYINRARLYMQEKKREEARRDLDKAVELGTPRNSLNYLYKHLEKKRMDAIELKNKRHRK